MRRGSCGPRSGRCPGSSRPVRRPSGRRRYKPWRRTNIAMPIASRVGPIRPAIIFVVAMRTPQGLHSDSTVHPGTLEELQYQSLLGPLWVKSRHRVTFASCPFFHSKQPFVSVSGASAKCHERTWATSIIALETGRSSRAGHRNHGDRCRESASNSARRQRC